VRLNKETISAASDKEVEEFENHSAPRSKARYCGRPFLAKILLICQVSLLDSYVSHQKHSARD
jgi:hypothetical protein